MEGGQWVGDNKLIMGGFQRYPWPQYINNAPFYWNKHWKVATACAFFCTLVNLMTLNRYTSNHSSYNPGYGSYIDPEHQSAPIVPKIF